MGVARYALLLLTRRHDQAIDDDLDRVLYLLVELDLFVEGAHFAINAHTYEALSPRLTEDILVLTLTLRDERGQYHEARARGELKHAVDHLLGTL